MVYELTYTLLGDDTYEVSGYTGQLVDLVIPKEYNGKTVTSIGAEAFRDCKSLVSVVITNNINSIGNKAFLNCGALKHLILGNNITTIASYAFRGCNNLNSILLLADTPANIATYTFNDYATIKTSFYCYRSALKAYKNANIWKNYTNNIVADDTKIAFTLNAITQKQYFAPKEEIHKVNERFDVEELDLAFFNSIY